MILEGFFGSGRSMLLLPCIVKVRISLLSSTCIYIIIQLRVSFLKMDLVGLVLSCVLSF